MYSTNLLLLQGLCIRPTYYYFKGYVFNQPIITSMVMYSTNLLLLQGLCIQPTYYYFSVACAKRNSHISLIQCQYFSEEIKCAMESVNLSHDIILRQPERSPTNVRLGLLDLPYDQKYPIIVPRCPQVLALIREVHLTIMIIHNTFRSPGSKGKKRKKRKENER